VSLREKLEAKQRKRLVVPVQVSDPSTEHEAYIGAASALKLAHAKEESTPEYIAQLEKLVVDAGERYRSHFVEVELQSLDRADWNAAMAKWMGEEHIDWDAALAPLLAESCTDEDLQDEQWWAERLAAPEWSEGDVDALKAAILTLNVTSMEARYPKG
jgi:hypothetical protein